MYNDVGIRGIAPVAPFATANRRRDGRPRAGLPGSPPAIVVRMRHRAPSVDAGAPDPSSRSLRRARGATRDDACRALAALAEREAHARPAPRELVRRLGLLGAGVRPGPLGLVDLARAGQDGLPGRGFRAELDDGTDGQVRHFCGIAACCVRFGGAPTRWVSIHLRRDPPETPDGRLTDLAIEFVRLLASGRLDVADAGRWLRRTLCDPGAAPEDDPADAPDRGGPGTPPA